MSGKPMGERERLEIALRALQQIDSIAGAVLDQAVWDTDLHYVLDGVGDIAQNALERACGAEVDLAAEDVFDEPCPMEPLEVPDDGEDDDPQATH